MLKVTDLCHGYRQGDEIHRVLWHLDMHLHAGESVALLGRSGSGKSTLLNMLAGIDRPDQGKVWIDGQEITGMDDRRRTLLRRQRIGFVYQFFNLLPTLTVAENIGLPLELDGQAESSIHERVTLLLAQLGLGDRHAAFPDQLSGGEQQRVAIARAVIHHPSLLLADEPTGNLDLATGKQVMDLLFELATAQGQTLLLVTHSLEVAHRADRVLQLENGHLAEYGGNPS